MAGNDQVTDADHCTFFYKSCLKTLMRELHKMCLTTSCNNVNQQLCLDLLSWFVHECRATCRYEPIKSSILKLQIFARTCLAQMHTKCIHECKYPHKHM